MKRDFNNTLKYYFIAFLCWIVVIPCHCFAQQEEELLASQEDTLLMFVGENIEVLSIASRRQESASQAPAVAQVITRRDFQEMGAGTLGQSLEIAPGFYMAKKDGGTKPYLRGIPDSVLFLYDTVPTGSDVTKFLHPLDNELSLASVKRIEIIRGPGSVLWGPDAFAGIVNVVPMTGKDLDGVETGILYKGPGDQGGFYLNAGHDAGLWDAFFSVSGRKGDEDDTSCNIVKFWGDGKKAVSPFEARLGDEKPGKSRYLEASGRFSFGKSLSVSGLLSDYRRPYAMSGDKEDLVWRESREGMFGFIKVEAKKELDQSSALRFTGSYMWLNPEYDIIDRTFDQKERTAYGEIIYDRSFFSGQGLLTGGMSYRKKHVDDAPIWKSYFPDYLTQESTSFLPLVIEEDYKTGLWSLFGQYTHKFGDFDLLFGLRQDNHDEYRDHLSYNAGLVWSPHSNWVLKALYGTAYRTPFAKQLLGDDVAELEKIKTLNVEISWRPSEHAGFRVCGFSSKLNNHIMEDPYAGLSLPNKQSIKGVEIEGSFYPVKELELSANLTLINNSGPDETYHYLKYIFPRPEYEDLIFPYDTGPRRIFNIFGTWRPFKRLSVFSRLGYSSKTRVIYPRGYKVVSIPGVWLIDMSATVKDVIVPGMELVFSARNLTNRHYETAGTYSAIHGAPFSLEIMLRKKW
ncbi:MAG TPA: TonB-dependent receptor [Desulfobacteraceae bacterium]|nr:TonB-dependent receptor [Desulfobacteraceae bacterium]HPJ67746.1 TonB-dependent receptor [Desulfobacteraceae bacterium]